jgi:hypothetical protein
MTSNGTDTPRLRRWVAVCGIALIALGSLTGCAPEDGDTPKDVAHDNSKPREDEGTPKTPKVTHLPKSFPDDIKIPKDAKIDNAGTRGDSVWFVSLRVNSLANATALRDAIAEHSKFSPEGDVAETSDGGQQISYDSPNYQVETLTQKDGKKALLNLDIEQANG